ncbi:MAG: ferrous iron transport protein B [Lachnospiraceae bacterium]|nr:ferrous iron transport protein B [Lachnospiraceae bacterium]
MGEEIRVAFVGNPNCGKTTLFNDYTGAKLKVANWPGVTVEKKEGVYQFQGETMRLVDLPGIYSLTSYTMEERVSRSYILGDEVNIVIDVADASSLERNLYLTLQLIELGKPVILALNMMDIVEERGMDIDLHRLPEMLGIPCIPVSARTKQGLEILMHAVLHHKDRKMDKNLEHHHEKEKISHHKHDHHRDIVMVYSDEIEDKIDVISERLEEKYGKLPNVRLYAIKYLEWDEEIRETYPIDTEGILDRSYETEIISEKYDFIEEIIDECLVGKSKKAEFTDKIDSVLTNRIWGVPIFLGIMALVFFLTFTIGDWLKGFMEEGLDTVTTLVLQMMETIRVGEVLSSLIVDGIIAGVGGILTFLPNIFILFLALAFLEDSGYMARVAYVMDGIMGKIGLSGRAFIPMLLGFGCTVPAVMASRALEDPKDRLKTILVTPFMSCSARLPIYVLFSSMFFPKYAIFVAYSMYLLGIVTAIAAALIMNQFTKRKEINTLLIELPEYKSPNLHTIAIYTWEKVEDYLRKAGTTIFLASIIIWVILNFGPSGMVTDMSQSFGAMAGRVIAPLMHPAGLDYWQVVVALIAGLAAKEIVVSSMSVLFGITNVTSAAGMAGMSAALGSLGFTAVNAYALMTFCLLYTPCMAAVATIRKETNSLKWTAFSALFQLLTAWIMATIVYQIGVFL